MIKVLILNGDAREPLEVMYPLQRMKEESYEIDVAAPEKKKIQLVSMILRMDSTHMQRNWAISFMRIWLSRMLTLQNTMRL